MEKRLSLLLTILCLLCFFTACSKPFSLEQNVSQLRLELFEGENENFSLKASYGFIETPFVNDGKVGTKVNQLNFKLLNKETDVAEHVLCLNYNGVSYKSPFKFDPLTHSMTASIKLDHFNLKEFDVEIRTASSVQTISMKSILPLDTMDYKTALKSLVNNQPELINNYRTDGNAFNGELYVRIVVKDQKAYWYIGIATGNEQLKALLIDGKNGDVLAVRDIF